MTGWLVCSSISLKGMNSMSSRSASCLLRGSTRQGSDKASESRETSIHAIPVAEEMFGESVTALNLCPTTDHEKPLLTSFERELGNALSIVNGNAELLASEASETLSADQRAWLASLLTACQRARDISDSYVALSRADRGEHSLARIAEHVVRGASWAALEMGATVRFLPFCSNSDVNCDVRATNKILQDVLRVLIRAGGHGAELLVAMARDHGVVTLTIRCRPGDVPGEANTSDVMLRAWRRTLALQGGALQLHLDSLSARVVLPLAG
jgi:hypothetical protein